MTFFDDIYKSGISPPWDIGHAQITFVKLEELGELTGHILDIGCGTGENSLFFAEKGYKVTGIDFSPKAIQIAKQKATERGLKVEFFVYDALNLISLKRTFDTAIDCGLFHTFSDPGRETYIKNKATVLKKNSKFFVLCFSDKGQNLFGGPRRISKDEINMSFKDNWEILSIKESFFETQLSNTKNHAWLATIKKI